MNSHFTAEKNYCGLEGEEHKKGRAPTPPLLVPVYLLSYFNHRESNMKQYPAEEAK